MSMVKKKTSHFIINYYIITIIIYYYYYCQYYNYCHLYPTTSQPNDPGSRPRPASIELSASPPRLSEASQLRASVQQGFLERWPQLRSWAEALCAQGEKAQDELMYWENYLGNPGLCWFFQNIFCLVIWNLSPSFLFLFLNCVLQKNPPFQGNLLGRCLHFIRHRPEQIQGKPGETVKEQFSRQIFNGQKSKNWVFESWRSHMGMGQDLLLPYKK